MFGLNSRQLLFILVLICALFAISQYAPAYISAFQFNDFIRQEVKYAATSRKPPDVLKSEIAKKATEFDIPITARDIRITRRGPSFTLELQYTWQVDLRLYQHNLKFHLMESGEVFENQ